MTLERDMINAKTGRVVAEAGTKMTPRQCRKLAEGGLTEIVVPAEDLYGRYVACDLINENTGEVLVEAGDELTEELFEAFGEASITDIPTLAIDHQYVGAYIRNTLASDKLVVTLKVLVPQSGA